MQLDYIIYELSAYPTEGSDGEAAQARIVPGNYIDSVGYYWVSSTRKLQSIEMRRRSEDAVPVEA